MFLQKIQPQLVRKEEDATPQDAYLCNNRKPQNANWDQHSVKMVPQEVVREQTLWWYGSELSEPPQKGVRKLTFEHTKISMCIYIYIQGVSLIGPKKIGPIKKPAALRRFIKNQPVAAEIFPKMSISAEWEVAKC